MLKDVFFWSEMWHSRYEMERGDRWCRRYVFLTLLYLPLSASCVGDLRHPPRWPCHDLGKKVAGLLHTRTSEGPQVIDLNRSDPIDLGWDLHAAVCEARIRSGPAQKTQDGFCVFGVWRRFVLKRLRESLPCLIWYKSCSLSFLSTSLPLFVRLTMPLQYTCASKLLYLWHGTLHLSQNFIQSVYPKFNYADWTRIQTITVYCQA